MMPKKMNYLKDFVISARNPSALIIAIAFAKDLSMSNASKKLKNKAINLMTILTVSYKSMNSHLITKLSSNK